MIIYKISHIKSKEFKEWFGDWEDPNAMSSKRKEPSSFAINNKGEPNTFYHGTTKDFQDFQIGGEGTNSNIFGSWITTRNAIFFTPNPEHANTFTTQGGETSGGNIMPVYLNVKSPLDLRNGIDDDTLNDFSSVGINWKWLKNFSWEHFDGEDGKVFVNAAKQLGYDGIIFIDEDPEFRNKMETWAVFSPSQIKSAIGNVGKYDPKNNDITAINKFNIYRLSKYQYKDINKVEEEDGFDKSKKWLDESNNVFQDSKIRYDSTKEINDIVLNNGIVIGTSATGWNTYGDKCIFSFDIAIQEKYRSQNIGTTLVERAINKFESERQEYSEIYGKDTIMQVEAVNVGFGEFLIKKYGFVIKQKLPDRIIIEKE